MVEFVGGDFLRGREGAKRVAIVLIWKGDILLILKFIVVGRILRVSRGLWVDVIGLLLLADLIAFRSDLYLLGVDV